MSVRVAVAGAARVATVVLVRVAVIVLVAVVTTPRVGGRVGVGLAVGGAILGGNDGVALEVLAGADGVRVAVAAEVGVNVAVAVTCRAAKIAEGDESDKLFADPVSAESAAG